MGQKLMPKIKNREKALRIHSLQISTYKKFGAQCGLVLVLA